jgi:nucleoid-associated protein YgaU
MGNSAKFMLVGILIVVLLIAIIWDRSSETTRGTEMNSLVNAMPDQFKTEAIPPETADANVNIGGDNTIKPIPDDMKDPFARKPGADNAAPAEPGEVIVKNGAPAQGTAPNVKAPEQPAAEKTYITVEGDSYWSVAEKVYGSGAKNEIIHKANMDVCPDPLKMKAGMKLIIPPLEGKPAVESQSVIKNTAGNKNTAKNAVPKTAPSHPKEYTVKAGDVLSKIAAKELGNSNRANEIYELNKDKLDSPDDLKIGQILRLP